MAAKVQMTNILNLSKEDMMVAKDILENAKRNPATTVEEAVYKMLAWTTAQMIAILETGPQEGAGADLSDQGEGEKLREARLVEALPKPHRSRKRCKNAGAAKYLLATRLLYDQQIAHNLPRHSESNVPRPGVARRPCERNRGFRRLIESGAILGRLVGGQPAPFLRKLEAGRLVLCGGSPQSLLRRRAHHLRGSRFRNNPSSRRAAGQASRGTSRSMRRFE